MTIKELENKHFNFSSDYSTEHIKLSIQFAIELLEEFYNTKRHISQFPIDLYDEIQYLKQYLNDSNNNNQRSKV